MKNKFYTILLSLFTILLLGCTGKPTNSYSKHYTSKKDSISNYNRRSSSRISHPTYSTIKKSNSFNHSKSRFSKPRRHRR